MIQWKSEAMFGFFLWKLLDTGDLYLRSNA